MGQRNVVISLQLERMLLVNCHHYVRHLLQGFVCFMPWEHEQHDNRTACRLLAHAVYRMYRIVEKVESGAGIQGPNEIHSWPIGFYPKCVSKHRPENIHLLGAILPKRRGHLPRCLDELHTTRPGKRGCHAWLYSSFIAIPKSRGRSNTPMLFQRNKKRVNLQCGQRGQIVERPGRQHCDSVAA